MPEISHKKMQLTFLLGVIATIGIARFCYTPMIPEMAEETGLSEAVAGYLAASNYAGYLSGALLISFIRSLSLKARLFKIGLICAVITSALMGVTTNELLWYLLRYLSGLSSAAGMLLGAGLLMHWLIKHNHRAILGVFFSGLGIGIVITAITAQLIDNLLDWSMQWQVYAVITLCMIIPVFRWLPDFSQEQPLSARCQQSNQLPSSFMPVLQLAYFCAGAGYVISATFLMAIAEGIPDLAGQGWLIWLVAGLACSPASALWDRTSHYAGQWLSLFIAYLLNAVSILILILSQDLIAVMTSALIYGASFIGIVSMMLAMVGRLFPDNPSKPMSRLTFSYGIAQMLAPAVVGFMAEYYGNFENGLILTLLIMICGTAALLCARWIEGRGTAENQQQSAN